MNKVQENMKNIFAKTGIIKSDSTNNVTPINNAMNIQAPANKVVGNNAISNYDFFEQPQNNLPPQREETEYRALSQEDFIKARISHHFGLTASTPVARIALPKLRKDLVPTIDFEKGICSINVGQFDGGGQLVGIGELKGNMSLDQVYSMLFGETLMQDHQSFENEQIKGYTEKYINAPINDGLAQAFSPTLEDLPENMQPPISIGSNTNLPLNAEQVVQDEPKKRGRKPKTLIDSPSENKVYNTNDTVSLNQGDKFEPLQKPQDLGFTKVAQVEPEALPTTTNKQKGVIEDKQVSFENFRPSPEFIEGLSTIITEIKRYFNQNN